MPAPRHPAPLPYAILAAVALTCGVVALSGRIGQDWVPFRVASGLVGVPWSEIYPASAARDLFDVAASFRAAAERHISIGGIPQVPEDTLTAFVSPAPSALLLRPLRNASWPVSLIAMRLALALPLLFVLFLFAVRGCTKSEDRLQWALITLLGTPLLLHIVFVGQPSAWLVAAAMISLMPARRSTGCGGDDSVDGRRRLACLWRTGSHTRAYGGVGLEQCVGRRRRGALDYG